MTDRRYLFSSEAVGIGHPDKLADQISDSILDAILDQDPNGRVACETMVATGMCLLAGEITTSARVDYAEIARQTIKDTGYTDSAYGLDGSTCAVLVNLGRQSPDIAMGVDEGESKEQGAGDQGLMFGFAVDETPELMPLPFALSHRIMAESRRVRESGDAAFKWLRPDGKCQVTVEYDGTFPAARPLRVETVVCSLQHDADVSESTLHEAVIEGIIKKALPADLIDEKTRFLVNPTGAFVLGGPQGDCGLTGRKIICDTYGGMGRHGGGAFSGKDPSKVDRSAAYMARYIAKNIVASGVSSVAEVQLAYAIGVAEPVSVLVNTFGKGKVSEVKLSQAVRDIFPLKPREIIEVLDLRRPIYRETATHGHFGRELPGFTWERRDKADAISSAVGIGEAETEVVNAGK